MQELKNDFKSFAMTTDMEFVINPRDMQHLQIDLIEVIKETIEAYNGHINGSLRLQKLEK